MSQRNCFTSFGFLDEGISRIHSNFSGIGVIPFPETVMSQILNMLFQEVTFDLFEFQISFSQSYETIFSNVQDGFPFQNYIQEYHLRNQK